MPTMIAQQQKTLLICDLDNTLYDWIHYFVVAFYDMVEEAVRITGCDREALLDDFRRVHQRHNDSEHPYSLLETKVICELFPDHDRKEIASLLDPAFHAFNSRRKRELKLHPDVRETLEELVRHNVILVAHTEAKLYSVVDRLRRLNLTGYFSRIYCRERPASLHPDPEVSARWLEKFPMEKIVELSHHQRKPNPDVLKEICEDEGVHLDSAVYIGDSMARDMLMAKEAGIYCVWAKYGAKHSKEDYERLVRVTHWTSEDVQQEKKLKKMARAIRPDFVAERSFSEIMIALGISPAEMRRASYKT